MNRIEPLIPIARDLVCLGLGSFGFLWQVTHGADLTIMLGCILLLCGPAVMGAWSLGRRGGTATTDGPSSSRSSSPPPPSSSSFSGVEQ